MAYSILPRLAQNDPWFIANLPHDMIIAKGPWALGPPQTDFRVIAKWSCPHPLPSAYLVAGSFPPRPSLFIWRGPVDVAMLIVVVEGGLEAGVASLVKFI